MTSLVGLFSRVPKDTETKKNIEKIKKIKKLAKEKKYADALKFGKEFLEKVSDHHDILFIVGSISYMDNKYKIAISYFERALEIGSYDTDVLLLKAYSHQKLGENKQAILCCTKIREIDPKNKAVTKLLEQLNS